MKKKKLSGYQNIKQAIQAFLKDKKHFNVI